MKKIILVCTMAALSSLAYSQAPANDDPCNAIPLTVGNTCTYQTFTNANATATTGVPNPTCANYLGGDVWFKVTATCTGSLKIDTQIGAIFDGGMAVYSGDCTGPLTQLICDDDGSSNGNMPMVIVNGLTTGQVIYVRVWEHGNNSNGQFGICVTEVPPVGPGGNCLNALPFCTSNVYTFPNATNVPTLGGGGIYGCLGSTPNPVWYYLQVGTSGDIVIGISQTTTSGAGIDVDYALWGPFANLAVSCPSLSASNNISCSYSPAPTETATIPNAQAGEFYILLLTNFSNQPGTITFQQSGGVGATDCGIVCNVTATNTGPVCPGGTFDLAATGVGANSYSWIGPGCFTSTAQNPTGVTAPTTPGTYVYTVTGVSSSGTQCYATTTLTVANTSSATSSVFNASCPGTTDGSITVNPTSPGTYTYTLTPGNVTQTSNVFTGLAPGTYSVSFTNGTCSGTLNNIVVGTQPNLTGTSTATMSSCPSVNNGTITVTPNGAGPYIYTLNPGNISQASNVFTGLAPGNYTVSFSTSTGCIGVVTPSQWNLVSGPPPPSSFTQLNPPCNNINDGSITVTPLGTAPYTITLTGPGGPVTQTNTTFTNLSPGVYNYTFTDAAGCTGGGGPITLTTNSPISATVTLTQPLCNGSSNGVITMAGAGGVGPYSYSINGGTTYQGPVFNNLPAGTYTIRIKDNFGCLKDTTVTLAEPTTLNASAVTVNATCSGNDGTITVTGSGGTAPYQYSIDNGTIYQNSPTFIAPAIGPYSTIKVKDANGCIASTSATVGYTDNMFLSAGNDTTMCQESSVTLQPLSNPGTSVFQWTPAASLNNPSIKNPVATPTTTTTYTLNATYGPCSRQDDVKVTILNKPVANAGADVTICHLDSTLLVGSATNLSGTVNYLWSPQGSVRDPNASSTIAFPDSTRVFTLTVTDNYGCNFSVNDKVTVTVRPPVPAFAGNDTLAIFGVPHQLNATGGASYVWSPALPLNSNTIANPLATLRSDVKFTVIVTDIAGCIGYDTIFVKAYDGPTYYTPNAFTPNGDGLNDIFRVIPVGIRSTEYFRIFNRYGELIFETNQWLKGWDGTYKGKRQPMGVYVWIVKGIDKLGNNVEMKGTVMLVQ